MNILPHKSWHVRTKKNIARVRADEAKAAEEEREKQRRIEAAEREARINILRNRATEAHDSSQDDKKPSVEENHVNFFQALEDGKADGINLPNADYLKEKKEEQEKYEKKIGYLTYLQDPSDVLQRKGWWEKLPSHSKSTQSDDEVELKKKSYYDPLQKIQKIMGPTEANDTKSQFTKKTTYTPILKDISLDDHITTKQIKNKKSKKHKKSSKKKKSKDKQSKKRKRCTSSSEEDSNSEEMEQLKKRKIEILRQERLKREAEEKLKANQLLAKLHGNSSKPVLEVKEKVTPVIKQKYNSQFNPELARQNYN